ncbi:glutamine-hydrolyzing GMP synthase [Myxococcota bacterium]|nr:glutamine-hydrolyzing GMP synthase [Myxococcota bacterium]
MKHDSIAVIDFGGQYAHLIATKVRRSGVLAEIRQPEDPIEMFQGYRGIILSGSPSLSAFGEESEWNKGIFELDIPILGFCFGHQEIAKYYGGKVMHGGREWGLATLDIIVDHPIFKGLARQETVWMSHFDTVSEIGPDFVEYAYSRLGETGKEHRLAAIGSDKYRRYGFQFHPEVENSVHGDQMIANFVYEICKCRKSWSMEAYLAEQVQRVREQVGDRSVFLLASGGVDSTVAAKLFGLAIGADRLHLLHVDNGMMRKGESARVLKMYADLGLDRNLHFVDATDEFLAAVGKEVDPEKKRRAIGNQFITVFEREAKRLGIEGHLLGQGTIYPDTIETGGTKRADTIKTHHNRVPVIEKMIAEGKVIEPLAELYKVEVRELGEKLGIPREAIWRHPFPGPGLGVRLLCSNGTAPIEDVPALQAAVDPIAKQFGLHARVLPIKSVGVKADLRSYEHPVMLTGAADFTRLQEAAGTILKEIQGINRCIWNLGTVAPDTIEVIEGYMTRDRLDLLREADQIVMDALRDHGLYDSIWQCPTAMVPLRINGVGSELVIVRPIKSERAMSATAAELPDPVLTEIRRGINRLSSISGLTLDLTSKPPGTIEWE